MAYKIKNTPFRQLGIATSLFGTNPEPLSAASAMVGNTPIANQMPISVAAAMAGNTVGKNQVPISTAPQMASNLAAQNVQQSQIKTPNARKEFLLKIGDQLEHQRVQQLIQIQ